VNLSTKPSRATGLDQIAHASREYIFCAPICISYADFDSVHSGGSWAYRSSRQLHLNLRHLLLVDGQDVERGL
jgi:hypothetical protein